MKFDTSGFESKVLFALSSSREVVNELSAPPCFELPVTDNVSF